MYMKRIYYIGCACFQILIELNAYLIYSIKICLNQQSILLRTFHFQKYLPIDSGDKHQRL